MTTIEVLGINIKRNPDWGRPTCIFAFGDIGLPELQTTFRGCALAKSNGRIIVMPPKLAGAHPGDLAAVQWNTSSPFAMAVKEKLMVAYAAMGGAVPSDKHAAPRRDKVTGKPIGSDPFDAPIERRTFPATFTVHEDDASDAEAVAGLHRTLGIEVEEAERACG